MPTPMSTGPEPGPTGFTPYPYGAPETDGVAERMGCSCRPPWHVRGISRCVYSERSQGRLRTQPADAEAEDDCPHCSPTHGSPHRCAWGVYIDDLVDGDGQPVRLIVQPTDGAHVAPADVRWLWQLIRNQPPDPPAPLPTRAEVLGVAEAAVRERTARALAAHALAQWQPPDWALDAVLTALHERGWLAWREET